MPTRPNDLVASSWERAAPVAPTVVRLFYRRLFELAPDLRGRVRKSLSEQCDHLIAAADELAERPNEPPGAVGATTEADPDHAPIVEAWLWALHHQIGGADTLRIGQAWRDAIQSDAGEEFRAVALGCVEFASA